MSAEAMRSLSLLSSWRNVSGKILAFAACLSAMLFARPVFAGECGMDNCPHGYTNLFYRDFDKRDYRNKWSFNGIIPFVCVVNSGGVVNVSGDLTLFIWASGAVEVSANCSVAIKTGGSSKTFTMGESGATFLFNGKEKRAETYIIEPQLERIYRDGFQSSFPNAVDIKCNFKVTN